MTRFKVAPVGLSGQQPPDFVPEQLANEEIDFIAYECTTREELAQYAGDADVVWIFGASEAVMAENLAAIPRCGAIID